MFFSDQYHAQLVRTLKGRKEAITVKVSRSLKENDPDRALRNGDILYVPKREIKMVGSEAIARAISIASAILLWKTIHGDELGKTVAQAHEHGCWS